MWSQDIWVKREGNRSPLGWGLAVPLWQQPLRYYSIRHVRPRTDESNSEQGPLGGIDTQKSSLFNPQCVQNRWCLSKQTREMHLETQVCRLRASATFSSYVVKSYPGALAMPSWTEWRNIGQTTSADETNGETQMTAHQLNDSPQTPHITSGRIQKSHAAFELK